MLRTFYIVITSILFLSLRNGDNPVIHEYRDAFGKITYTTLNGRIHGAYVSYYENGTKRAEGNFDNNYRTGLWTVWDSTGKIRVQRKYKNPFSYEKIVPAVINQAPIQLLDVIPYEVKYNSSGFITNFRLEESMCIWEKRIWRFVPVAGNDALMENDRLYNLFNKLIKEKKITAYGVKDDQFREELKEVTTDTANRKIIGFKIKEDWFFDNERMLSETRVLGICPVTATATPGDTLDMYWIWYPETREYMAKLKFNNEKIKSLDDVFFFRNFSGTIYKESTVHDRPIAAYKKGDDILREAEHIEIGMIETEHRLWLNFTK